MLGCSVTRKAVGSPSDFGADLGTTFESREYGLEVVLFSVVITKCHRPSSL